MKNQFFFLMALAMLIISSCSVDTIEGSGVESTQIRDVQTFNKVKSEGVFDITVIQSDFQLVEITADNNILHLVKTEVLDNMLILKLDDDNNYSNINVKATIYVESINEIKNSGSGNITAIDILQIGNFKVENIGSGDITLDGASNELTLINEGSGEVHAFDFATDNCDIKIDGSGDCEVFCNDHLNVKIEGSGDIFYIGEPIINSNITGSGNVISAN